MKIISFFLSGTLVLFVAGCSQGEKLPTVPVTGTVTLDGAPLEGATVAFNNVDGKPANGVTDAQGKFRLKTLLAGQKQAEGALPGDYTVMVTKYENAATSREEGEGALGPMAQQKAMEEAKRTGKSMQMPGAPKLVTPEKYSNAGTTPFKATVKDSGNDDFKFDMKAE